MDSTIELQSFGSAIKNILHKNGINAEQLVSFMNATSQVQTNKSALSRIMTGKRMPTEHEVKVMGDILGTPLLYEAYQCLNFYQQTHDGVYALAFHEKVDMLIDNQESPNEKLPSIDFSILFGMVKSLQRYCLTQNVSDQVHQGFKKKLGDVKGFGDMLDRLKLFYRCFVSGTGLAKADRALLGAALLYFISPIDLIPDYLFPYGYLDDAIVVGFVFNKLGSTLQQLSQTLGKTALK